MNLVFPNITRMTLVCRCVYRYYVYVMISKVMSTIMIALGIMIIYFLYHYSGLLELNVINPREWGNEMILNILSTGAFTHSLLTTSKMSLKQYTSVMLRPVIIYIIMTVLVIMMVHDDEGIHCIT